MNEFFRGWYYKHQAGDHTLAIIPGRTHEMAFIQIITERGSHVVDYDLSDYREGAAVQIGESVFSGRGIHLDIHTVGIELTGDISCGALTPIAGDIMGPLRHIPMECRHGIISLRHALTGNVMLDGECLCFDGGLGYIEMDSGTSFPSHYAWAQSNDFQRPCCVVAAAARIPFLGLHFRGCIAIVWIAGREYRLATYCGARVLKQDRDGLILTQGCHRLEVAPIAHPQGHALRAPTRGQMNRIVHEAACCPVRFRFYERGQLLLDEVSQHASYEIAPS